MTVPHPRPLIVNRGVQGILNTLKDQAWQIAVGSGSTNPWFDNLTLENETGRVDATVSLATTVFENDTLLFEGTIVFVSEMSISEIGIFNVESTEYMLLRRVFSAIPLPATVSMPVRYRVHFKIG